MLPVSMRWIQMKGKHNFIISMVFFPLTKVLSNIYEMLLEYRQDPWKSNRVRDCIGGHAWEVEMVSHIAIRNVVTLFMVLFSLLAISSSFYFLKFGMQTTNLLILRRLPGKYSLTILLISVLITLLISNFCSVLFQWDLIFMPFFMIGVKYIHCVDTHHEMATS